MATMKTMSRFSLFAFAFVCAALATNAPAPAQAQAQDSKGSLEFSAQITPTAAKPEPVRQFTFYLLTRSYADIMGHTDADNAMPPREEFIDGLKVSKEMKQWLKKHDIMDLTQPDTDKLITAQDVINVPEFLAAYQRANSGGVTNGIPKPKYKESEKDSNPDKYKKDYDDYITQLKKFLAAHPESISGIELELEGVNPARKWAALKNDHEKKVHRLAPAEAQTKYLVTQVDTNLDGWAAISNIPPGNYWLSTIGLQAQAGDVRLQWDVPVAIQPGQTTRIRLTNVNGTDSQEMLEDKKL